ncbi:MAG TPA: polysaccharide deacetylase family protein [Cyclobacteriaceae bacterium]|nr:polysaccharide deacetylase family protein [Cyclobacteriaceae bacterium]
MPGIFSISLDFELHWGGFEKWKLEISNEEFRIKNDEVLSGLQSAVDSRKSAKVKGKEGTYNQYFLNTRKVIPQMLTLFQQFKVRATWATVGLLFHEHRQQLQQHLPAIKPAYQQQHLSAYHYIEHVGIGEDEAADPFHYALSLIKLIQATPGQEIGTHTFAHYYCNETGQNTEQFRADLRAAQKAARAHGITLTSLVFPRNQFNDAYLKVCEEEGIKTVRSNPAVWYWHIDTAKESIWKRINRGVDAYLPYGKSKSFVLNTIPLAADKPFCIPASRFLRPPHARAPWLNRLRIKRILAEMTHAAQSGEVYHLWWHPHNFGAHPQQSMEELTEILKHYQYLQQKFGMQSCSMQDLLELRESLD